MLNKNSLLVKQEINSRVSIVLNVVDDFSDEKPLGNIRLILQDENFNIVNVNAIKNLSGLYVYTDLEPGRYFVRVLNEYYIDAQNEVIVTDYTEKEKIKPVDIYLKPNSRYPFRNNATLIGGKVCNKNGAGINKVPLTIQEMNFSSYTDEDGRFVVYFKDFSGFAEDKGIYLMDVLLNFEFEGTKLSSSVEAVYGKTVFCEVIAKDI